MKQETLPKAIVELIEEMCQLGSEFNKVKQELTYQTYERLIDMDVVNDRVYKEKVRLEINDLIKL